MEWSGGSGGGGGSITPVEWCLDDWCLATHHCKEHTQDHKLSSIHLADIRSGQLIQFQQQNKHSNYIYLSESDMIH